MAPDYVLANLTNSLAPPHQPLRQQRGQGEVQLGTTGRRLPVERRPRTIKPETRDDLILTLAHSLPDRNHKSYESPACRHNSR